MFATDSRRRKLIFSVFDNLDLIQKDLSKGISELWKMGSCEPNSNQGNRASQAWLSHFTCFFSAHHTQVAKLKLQREGCTTSQLVPKAWGRHSRKMDNTVQTELSSHWTSEWVWTSSLGGGRTMLPSAFKVRLGETCFSFSSSSCTVVLRGAGTGHRLRKLNHRCLGPTLEMLLG